MKAIIINFEIESNSDTTKTFKIYIKSDGIKTLKDMTKSRVSLIAYKKSDSALYFTIIGNSKTVGEARISFSKNDVIDPIDLYYFLREITLTGEDIKLVKGDLRVI